VDEWNAWNRLGDPVLHIDLRDWADVLLLAPLSAHSLAKIAHGMCDDTLSCVARAWDFGHYDKTDRCTKNNSESNEPRARGKPVLLAPAMNTAMWEHPLTEQQLQTIQSFAPASSGNVKIVPPQSKLLACGEVGVGAMASVDTILQAVQSVLQCK
jgi:phosphopantothenoylcysteine decarboxylase